LSLETAFLGEVVHHDGHAAGDLAGVLERRDVEAEIHFPAAGQLGVRLEPDMPPVGLLHLFHACLKVG
jgi:hypothetical protein